MGASSEDSTPDLSRRLGFPCFHVRQPQEFVTIVAELELGPVAPAFPSRLIACQRASRSHDTRLQRGTQDCQCRLVVTVDHIEDRRCEMVRDGNHRVTRYPPAGYREDPF